jgi:hypothetical protein
LIESYLATNDRKSLLAQDLQPLDSEFREKESSHESEDERVVAPPLDILVRTSDVHRLSDFLMWQVRPLPLPTSYTVYSLESRCADIVGDFPALRESALAAVRAAGNVQGVVGVAEGCVDASVEGLGRATKRKMAAAKDSTATKMTCKGYVDIIRNTNYRHRHPTTADSMCLFAENISRRMNRGVTSFQARSCVHDRISTSRFREMGPHRRYSARIQDDLQYTTRTELRPATS